MAAAATTKQDNRKPNFQPNTLPAEVAVSVLVAGKVLGTIGVKQGDKLSPGGAITYFGGITKGWKLPGDSNTALNSLSFSVNGTELARSPHGVHANKGGNPCVFFSTSLSLSVEGGDPITYMVQVTATYRMDKGFYTLQILASPAGVGGGGPIVRGDITGKFQIDGFSIEG